MRGDVVEVYPAYEDDAYRIELWGDEVERLAQIDPLLGQVRQKYARLPICPKTHYVMTPETKERAVTATSGGAGRWQPRAGGAGQARGGAAPAPAHACFDLEMMKEMGYCHGIENYSRHFTGRQPGEPPPTLLDYFPRDLLCSSWTRAT